MRSNRSRVREYLDRSVKTRQLSRAEACSVPFCHPSGFRECLNSGDRSQGCGVGQAASVLSLMWRANDERSHEQLAA